MSEWKSAKLGDENIQIIDGDRGTNYPSKADLFSAGDCLFLNAGNVASGGLNLERCEFITEDRDALLRKGKLARFDCVLTTRGTVGNVAFYEASIPFEHVRINSGMVIMRPNTSKIDPRFLYLYLRSDHFSGQVKSLTSGSAQPQIPIRDLRQVEFPLPPLPEQRDIAAVLGTLDDKIELNRKTAVVLEEMARALYRSWFVDFDPVWARAEGRPPAHMDAPNAALFPDGFDDAGLPLGWKKMKMSEICSRIFSGGTPKTDQPSFWGGPFSWLSSGETRQNFIVETEKTITQLGISGSSTRLARSGSVVIASAGQGKTRGQTSFLTFDAYINQSVIACEANHLLLPDAFLYCDLARRYEEFRGISDGNSSRGSLTTKLVGGMQVIVPPQDVAEAFGHRVAPSFECIKSLLLENQTLEELRDSLLPRLMSGELRVGAAREMLDEVA